MKNTRFIFIQGKHKIWGSALHCLYMGRRYRYFFTSSYILTSNIEVGRYVRLFFELNTVASFGRTLDRQVDGEGVMCVCVVCKCLF